MDVYDVVFSIASRLLPYSWFVIFFLLMLLMALRMSLRNIRYLGKVRDALKIYIDKNSDVS